MRDPRVRGLLVLLLAASLAAALAFTGCGRRETAPAIPSEQAAEEESPSADAPAVNEDGGTETGDEAAATGEESPATPKPAAPSFGARALTVIKVVAIFVGKVLFLVALPAAVAGTLFGMPGSVLVLVAGTIYSALHGWASPPWWVLLVLVGLALAAEFAESVLAFARVRQSGASNSTGLWVLAGGFVGAVLGGLIAAPLGSVGALAGPVGWIVLSIVPPIGLGMVGGYLGGYWRERRAGRSPDEARRAGWAALVGRVAGSFAKALLVAVMATILLIASWPTLI